MTLNDYWRGCIEAGPIEPPLSTFAYRTNELQFSVWDMEWTIGEAFLPVVSKLADTTRIAANDIGRAFLDRLSSLP